MVQLKIFELLPLHTGTSEQAWDYGENLRDRVVRKVDNAMQWIAWFVLFVLSTRKRFIRWIVLTAFKQQGSVLYRLLANFAIVCRLSGPSVGVKHKAPPFYASPRIKYMRERATFRNLRTRAEVNLRTREQFRQCDGHIGQRSSILASCINSTQSNNLGLETEHL